MSFELGKLTGRGALCGRWTAADGVPGPCQSTLDREWNLDRSDNVGLPGARDGPKDDPLRPKLPALARCRGFRIPLRCGKGCPVGFEGLSELGSSKEQASAQAVSEVYTSARPGTETGVEVNERWKVVHSSFPSKVPLKS